MNFTSRSIVFAGVLVSHLHLPASAQVRVGWSQTFDGAGMGYDVPGGIATAPDGTVFVTANSQQAGPAPAIQATLTRAIDTAGNTLWTQVFTTGTGYVWPTAIALSSQDDVYVAGYRGPTLTDDVTTYATLLKYSSTGVFQWAREWGAQYSHARANSLAIDAQGNVYAAGSEGPSGAPVPSLRKIDPAGNTVWIAQGTGAVAAGGSVRAPAIAANGDIVVVGSTPGQFSDFLVMRFDPSGNLLWFKQVDSGAMQGDFATDVVLDAQGNVYASGAFGSPSGYPNAAVIAFDSAGNELWRRVIDTGAQSIDRFNDIQLDPFARLVASGSARGATGHLAIATHVLDLAGNTIWSRAWESPTQESADLGRLAIDAIGDIHVAGYALVGGTTRAVEIEYDPSGDLRAQFVSTPSAQDAFWYIAPNKAGTVDCVGWSGPGQPEGDDLFTVQIERTATPYCFGDGSGSACPCGNASAPIEQAGCANSLGLGGRLIDRGASSLSADTLKLVGSNMTNAEALYFQGTLATAHGNGTPFGDGLRCASGTIVRLATKTNANGASQFPDAPGDVAVSLRGGVIAPGQRTYQAWYRNSAAFCTSSTFNLTNGLRVTWIP